MAKTIKVTGTFKDLSDRPLKGKITFTAQPEYLVDKQADVVYSGAIDAVLDDQGRISVDLLPAASGWKYALRFHLTTQEGSKVSINPTYVALPESGPLPDYLFVDVDPGSRQPRLLFEVDEGNQNLIVTGAEINPNDEGSILIPITSKEG